QDAPELSTHVVQERRGGPAPIAIQRNRGRSATIDPVEEDWQIESDEAANLAKAAAPDDRAFGHRLLLLLNETRPVHFADEGQVVEFIHRCHQKAAKEPDTLKAAAAAGRLTRQN